MRLLRVDYFRAGLPFIASLPRIYPEVNWSDAYGTNFRRNISARSLLSRFPDDWILVQVELLLESGSTVVYHDMLRNFRPGNVFHLFFSHECLDNVDLGCPTGSFLDLNLGLSFPFPVIDDSFLFCGSSHNLLALG